MPIRRKGHAKAVENEGASEQESDMKIDRAEEDENGGQRAGKARRSTANAGNAAPAPPLEPPPPFDPKSFHHQPIPAAHHPKMKAISDSWDIPKGPLDLLAQLVRESAVLLTDADEEANATTLRMLDKAMREVVDMENELSARKNAAMALRQSLTRGEVIVGPAAAWENSMQKDIKKYQKSTSRQKYANSSTYMGYREELWHLKNEGAMPPLKSVIPKEDGDESDDEDEVEVGGMVQTFRDPLTKAWLEDPVTSKKCHHSYSRASMYDYLCTTREVKKCPATGCSESVSRVDLEDDENLARQVRNARRKEEQEKAKKGRRKMAVDDSDDDIVE